MKKSGNKTRMTVCFLLFVAVYFSCSSLLSQNIDGQDDTIIRNLQPFDLLIDNSSNVRFESIENKHDNDYYTTEIDTNLVAQKGSMALNRDFLEREHFRWTDDVYVLNSENHERHPSMAYDYNNYPNVFVAAELWNGLNSPRDIIFKRSTDHGETWTSSSTNQHIIPGSTYPLTLPKITQISSSHIGMVFVRQFNVYDNDFDILFRKFHVNNVSSYETSIIDATVANLTRPAIASDYIQFPYNPYIHVSYIDRSGTHPIVYYKRSTNGGASWSGSINISYINSQVSPNYLYTSIDCHGDNVVIAYVDKFTTNPTDMIYIAFSSDAGNTWTLSSSIIGSYDYHYRYPQIRYVNSSNIIITYEQWYSETNRNVRYSYSTDGGANWISGILANTAADERFPNISSHKTQSGGSDVYVSYTLLPNQVMVRKANNLSYSSWSTATNIQSSQRQVSNDDVSSIIVKPGPNGSLGSAVAWASYWDFPYENDLCIFYDAEWRGTTPTPTLSVNPNELTFGNVVVGNYAIQSYNLTGSNLTSSVIVTAPTGYLLSISEYGNYYSTRTFNHTQGSVNQVVWVKFQPDNNIPYPGNITNVSTGATTRNVYVTGTGISTTTPVAIPPSAGNGTISNPYQIASLGNLYWIAENSSRWSYHYIQTSDINATPTNGWFEGQGWNPIGVINNEFTGSYDGQNHEINGLFINRLQGWNPLGLFGNIDNGAVIKNLGLIDVNVSGYSAVGGLVGVCDNSTIENCFVTGDITGDLTGPSGDVIGGLIGQVYNSVINNCYTIVDIDASGSYPGSEIGGLVGENVISIISNSYSIATVTGGSCIGGLVGRNNGPSVSIQNCYSQGTVNGISPVGGLIGYHSGSVVNSYSKSIVNGNSNVGGLAGRNYRGAIIHCYSIGTVSGSSDTGGLVGSVDTGGIYEDTNNYWNTQTSGQTNSAMGYGRSTNQMTYPHETNTYAGWNFDDIWAEDYNYNNNDGYPFFQTTDFNVGGVFIENTSSTMFDDNQWELSCRIKRGENNPNRQYRLSYVAGDGWIHIPLGVLSPGYHDYTMGISLFNENDYYIREVELKIEYLDSYLIWITLDSTNHRLVKDKPVANDGQINSLIPGHNVNSLIREYSPILKFDYTDDWYDHSPPINITSLIEEGDCQILSWSNQFDPINLTNPGMLLNYNRSDNRMDIPDPIIGDNWNPYYSSIDKAIYARVIIDDITVGTITWFDCIVIQYWLPYPVSCLDRISNYIVGNNHEGESENIAIVLVNGINGYQPMYAFYAKHYKGSWTTWENVAKYATSYEITNRPIVYVSNGSHASFFSSDPSETTHTLITAEQGAHEGKYLWYAYNLDVLEHFDVIPMPSIDSNLNPQFSWLKFEGKFGGSKRLLTRFPDHSPPFFPYTKYSDPITQQPYDQYYRWSNLAEWIHSTSTGSNWDFYESGIQSNILVEINDIIADYNHYLIDVTISNLSNQFDHIIVGYYNSLGDLVTSAYQTYHTNSVIVVIPIPINHVGDEIELIFSGAIEKMNDYVSSVTYEIFKTIKETISVSPVNEPPLANSYHINQQPSFIYPDTALSYEVKAKYFDPDGRHDLKYAYLKLIHPTDHDLVMRYSFETGLFSPLPGNEGANYLQIDDVTTQQCSENNVGGYELTWEFTIHNENWATAEGGINFAVLAQDYSNSQSNNGVWSIDNSNSSFKQYGITFISHGYQLDGIAPTFGWMLNMATAVKIQLGNHAIIAVYNKDNGLYYSLENNLIIDPGENELVLLFDWASDSSKNFHGFSEAAADAGFASLMQFRNTNNMNYLHLIGHSRGAVVVSEIAERMIVHERPVKHVTYIDPHDWGGLGLEFASDTDVNQGLSIPNLPNSPAPTNFDNSAVVGWQGISLIDTYWQHDIGPGLSGRPVSGSYNYKVLNTSHTNIHGRYTDTISDPSISWGYKFSRIGNRNNEPPAYPLEFSGETRPPWDYNIALTGIFNGSFHHSCYTEILWINTPGWSYHGGETGISYLENELVNHLVLTPWGTTIKHNRFFIPDNIEKIYFNHRTVFTLPGTNDVLRIFLNDNHNLGNSWLLNETMYDWSSQYIDIPPSIRGTIATLNIVLDNLSRPDQRIITSWVWVDNVQFSYTEVPAAPGGLMTFFIESYEPIMYWSPFSNNQRDLIQEGYQIRVRNLETEEIVYNTGFIFDPNGHSHLYSTGSYTGFEPISGDEMISNQLLEGQQYNWNVRYMGNNGQWSLWASDLEGGFSVFSVPSSFTTMPPQNLSISVSDNFVNLNWEPLEGAISYQVYSSSSPYVNFFIDDTGIFQGSNWSSLIRNEKSFYYVTALIDETPDDLIFVMGGTFNPTDSYTVTLSSFYISSYEVTQGEYSTVMGVNPSNFPGNLKRPVENINWFNAIEYCNRLSIMAGLSPVYSYLDAGTDPDQWYLDYPGWNTADENHLNVSCNWFANGYRLPTDMERGFAARGGFPAQIGGTFDTLYPGTDLVTELDDYAWYRTNAGSELPGGSTHPDYGTHPVGLKLPNELGLYDMAGNVWNWCWDIYQTDAELPIGHIINPTGPVNGTQRVGRGGSWSNTPASATVLFRGYENPIVIRTNIGFRVCRNAQ